VEGLTSGCTRDAMIKKLVCREDGGKVMMDYNK
jgi:hypothetical protein